MFDDTCHFLQVCLFWLQEKELSWKYIGNGEYSGTEIMTRGLVKSQLCEHRTRKQIKKIKF